MKELISVIINVYNGEKYIEKCLDSIINQTYKNLEIIIVNDGSTDNTLNICQKYEDKRIKIINQKNIGLSLSRNVGLDNASGEYVYFIDCDDFVEKDVIEYLYKLSKKYNASVSTCNPMDIYDYNFKVKKQKEKIEIISKKDMLKKILLSSNRAGTIWNKLIKKDLFNEIRFQDRKIDDIEVTFKIVLVADKIVYSNKIKYFYLRHRDSFLGKKDEDISNDIFVASRERYKHIKNVYPNFIENEIGMMIIIMTLYSHDKKKINDFLDKNEAKKIFKQLYSIKIIWCKMKFKDKIKILLFRINPNMYMKILIFYMKLKR